jgi:hypothetical protein
VQRAIWCFAAAIPGRGSLVLVSGVVIEYPHDHDQERDCDDNDND